MSHLDIRLNERS